MSDKKVTPMLKCGHCNVGHHETCPSGVRNGDGSIVRCNCTHGEGCRAGQVRCTDCNNREPGTVGEDWRCLNKNDCEAEQERKALLNPTVQRVRAVREAHGKAAPGSQGTDTPDEGARRSRTPRKAGDGAPKQCLCGCNETTGGGRFRPGHDSRYLTQLVAAQGDESRTLAYAVSDAFGAKYEKRLAK